MLRKIITSTLLLALTGGFLLAFSPSASAQAPAPAATPDNSVQERFCEGVNTNALPADTDNLAGGSKKNCTEGAKGTNTTANRIIKNVVNILSLIVGIVAVIMIVFGGFKYVTSGGDSGRVTSAKNTILYAVIGLIIVALAQIIVRFVIGKATGATTGGAPSGTPPGTP